MAKVKETKDEPKPAEMADDEIQESEVPSGQAHRIRVSASGGRETYDFKGKRFTKAGVTVSPGKLGWSDADWKAAHADPFLAIEAFDKTGALVETPSKK